MDHDVVKPAKKIPTIALVGNPNSGKTSLFNSLSGLNQRVGNIPGVTVERKKSKLTEGANQFQQVDLHARCSHHPRHCVTSQHEQPNPIHPSSRPHGIFPIGRGDAAQKAAEPLCQGRHARRGRH